MARGDKPRPAWRQRASAARASARCTISPPTRPAQARALPRAPRRRRRADRGRARRRSPTWPTSPRCVWQFVPELNWAGFYRAIDGELVLGPFCGKPACIRIPFGRGCAARRRPRARPSWSRTSMPFPAISPATRRAAPSWSCRCMRDGAVIAVIDLDSPRPGAVRRRGRRPGSRRSPRCSPLASERPRFGTAAGGGFRNRSQGDSLQGMEVRSPPSRLTGDPSMIVRSAPLLAIALGLLAGPALAQDADAPPPLPELEAPGPSAAVRGRDDRARGLAGTGRRRRLAGRMAGRMGRGRDVSRNLERDVRGSRADAARAIYPGGVSGTGYGSAERIGLAQPVPQCLLSRSAATGAVVAAQPDVCENYLQQYERSYAMAAQSAAPARALMRRCRALPESMLRAAMATALPTRR